MAPYVANVEPRRADVIVPLQWPEEADRREQLALAGVPRLLLVSHGARPPGVWGVDEDWISVDAPAAERSDRETTLRRRLELRGSPTSPTVGVVLDEDGLVRRAGRWVALSEIETRLVGLLLAAAGKCVSRAQLLDAGWPGEEREGRAVDGAVRRARTKLRVLGVEIHGITGVGYLLEVGGTPVP